MNVAMRLGDDLNNNPPSPGIAGSLDIAFDTPVGATRTANVDTEGLVAGYGANETPYPGAVVLRGAGGSRLRISDAAALAFPAHSSLPPMPTATAVPMHRRRSRS
jgi:hypothetical protein